MAHLPPFACVLPARLGWASFFTPSTFGQRRVRSLGAWLVLAAVILSPTPTRAVVEEDAPEPTVAYVAGNIPLERVIASLFKQAERKYRYEGRLPSANVTIALNGLPLTNALKRLAEEAGATLEIQISGGTYVLKWKTPEPAKPVMAPPPPAVPQADAPVEPPAVPLPFPEIQRDAQGVPIVPMVFPVLGNVSWSDTWGAPRGGGKRKHQGQDLMAPKMRPLVAAFDGVVSLSPRPSHYTLSLRSDFGYSAVYMHVNNDTPGTDDGLGGGENAFAPGLKSGDRVVAGQLLGWVGDSGNAEHTAPHCHFELSGPEGVFNPAPSLRSALKIEAPVVNIPALVEEPAPGETRWDGIVREFQPEWNLAVIDLIAHGPSGNKMLAATLPQRQWVRLGKARIHVPGEMSTGLEPIVIEPAAITPGMRVSIIGEAGPQGKAGTGRVAVIHSPLVVMASRTMDNPAGAMPVMMSGASMASGR